MGFKGFISTVIWEVSTGQASFHNSWSLNMGDNIKLYLHEVGRGHGLDSSGSGKEEVSGSCRCGNEPTGSMKCVEFVD